MPLHNSPLGCNCQGCDAARMIRRLSDALDKVRRQRDDLVEAGKALLEGREEIYSTVELEGKHDRFAAAIKKAQEAI